MTEQGQDIFSCIYLLSAFIAAVALQWPDSSAASIAMGWLIIVFGTLLVIEAFVVRRWSDLF